MSHEEILKEALEEHEDHKPKSTISKVLLSLFLVLLMVMFIVPIYSIKFDPMPKNIPTLADVVTEFKEVNNSIVIGSKQDYYKLLNPSNSLVKQIAVKIATESCDSLTGRGKLCQAKAIYYFVRDNIKYVSDPVRDEYVETAEEVLITGGSDCDGMAILLANFTLSLILHQFVELFLKTYLFLFQDFFLLKSY